MKANIDRISIIIPHYNSTGLLVKLLKTIPNDERIEVIVVDDNSSDSLEPIEQYVVDEKRNNIILAKNDSGMKGAGSSRNIGLKLATGSWLLFADSDDYFMDGWYDVVQKYLNSEYDMVYFMPTSIDLNTNRTSSRHVMYAELVEHYHRTRSQKALLELKYCFCTPWSKMIRRAVVEKYDLVFDEVPASNDIMFITKSAFYSESIAADMGIIYCVTRGGSSLTSKKDKAKFMSRVNVLIDRYNFLRNHLSKKEFRIVHIDRYALGKLVDIVIEKWGLHMFFEVMKLFHDNKIAIWDVGLLNPFTLFHKAKIELAWWRDIKKSR